MAEGEEISIPQKPERQFDAQEHSGHESAARIAHPAPILQRAAVSPKSLLPVDIIQLQNTVGNSAATKLLRRMGCSASEGIQMREDVIGSNRFRTEDYGTAPENSDQVQCINDQRRVVQCTRGSGPKIVFNRGGVEYGIDEEIDRREREEQAEYLMARKEFLNAYPGASVLVNDIDLQSSASNKLTILVNNFKKLKFTYSMKFEAQEDKILTTGGGSGDCHTLALVMYKVATECLLIPAVSLENCSEFMAAGNRTIDNAKDPNGPNNQFWLFENHYWISGPGGEYDPLFGAKVDKTSWKMKRGEKEVKGSPYYITEEIYGDTSIFGPFFGWPNTFTVDWNEAAWLAHKKVIDENLQKQEEQQKAKDKSESSDAAIEEESPHDQVMAMLKEVAEFPADKMESTIERILSKIGVFGPMAVINELKMFCSGNLFDGFNFEGDKWIEWCSK